jgi:hypothetical protein
MIVPSVGMGGRSFGFWLDVAAAVEGSALRIPSNLKVQLEEIASSEGRSTAQIGEAFLRAGTDNYRKKASKFINGFIAQQKKSIPDEKGSAGRL